jgi:hypothetical protein
MMRDLTHELSSSDCFGKFYSWFRMPLAKVEVLMSTLINHGCIVLPRLHRHRSKFREQSEFLVMSALNILANGTSFWLCKALCNISTSEVRKFFFLCLDAIVNMKMSMSCCLKI